MSLGAKTQNTNVKLGICFKGSASYTP